MPEETTGGVPRPLLDAARAAGRNAYAPYSGFRVGAAVLTEAGGVYAGANVENASYDLTMCAERSAIFHAVAREGADCRIRSLLVYTATAQPTTPCGACRQVLIELGPDAVVYCVSDGAPPVRYTIAELLPDAFRLPER